MGMRRARAAAVVSPALTWVVAGYTVTGGGTLMLGGRMGDLLGR
ncbi:hypothetical protein STENM327S_01799 [Streptomyces tendae]